MAGTIYSGTYVNGIVLDDPATQLPATVTGSVSNKDGDAIYGKPGGALDRRQQRHDPKHRHRRLRHRPRRARHGRERRERRHRRADQPAMAAS